MAGCLSTLWHTTPLSNELLHEPSPQEWAADHKDDGDVRSLFAAELIAEGSTNPQKIMKCLLRAISSYGRALSALSKEPNSLLKAKILQNLGRAYRQLQEWQPKLYRSHRSNAVQYLQSAASMLEGLAGSVGKSDDNFDELIDTNRDELEESRRALGYHLCDAVRSCQHITFGARMTDPSEACITDGTSRAIPLREYAKIVGQSSLSFDCRRFATVLPVLALAHMFPGLRITELAEFFMRSPEIYCCNVAGQCQLQRGAEMYNPSPEMRHCFDVSTQELYMKYREVWSGHGFSLESMQTILQAEEGHAIFRCYIANDAIPTDTRLRSAYYLFNHVDASAGEWMVAGFSPTTQQFFVACMLGEGGGVCSGATLAEAVFSIMHGMYTRTIEKLVCPNESLNRILTKLWNDGSLYTLAPGLSISKPQERVLVDMLMDTHFVMQSAAKLMRCLLSVDDAISPERLEVIALGLRNAFSGVLGTMPNEDVIENIKNAAANLEKFKEEYDGNVAKWSTLRHASACLAQYFPTGSFVGAKSSSSTAAAAAVGRQ